MIQEELLKLRDSMSLKEKVGQMVQLVGMFWQEKQDKVLTGPARELRISEEDMTLCGSVLGIYGAGELIRIQKDHIEKHPHHIPLLFMLDVIHGMKTVFPEPLAQGATFEPELAEKCAAAAAREAAVSGIHVTFAPMVDLVRDARWGRVLESTGEDPYLNSLVAEAQVRGFQGNDMSKPGKVCSCVKHFAAYGGVVAGKEYNTVELSEHTLREAYLKAYQAGIEAGAGMVMASFNTVNGIPASTNRWLMKDILRDEMGFDGVLISDFASIYETIAHGYSDSEADAAKRAVEAGMDIDMVTRVYSENLCALVEEGIVPEELIDQAVLRILELKNKLGLFENPYKDADPEKEREIILCEEHRRLARETAAKSFVLLKNSGILPVDTSNKIAFVGPYVNCREMKSNWAFVGDAKDCITIQEAASEIFDPMKTTYRQGSGMVEDVLRETVYDGNGPEPEQLSYEEQEGLLEEAVKAAKSADVVVMALGESYLQSGEAASRAMIDIPEVQMRLFRRIWEVNKNIVVVLFSGRPLDLREISEHAKAILQVWLPGTEGGHAIVDVLTGKVNPSGKLPMSFPYCVGQIPVYYNAYATGRPDFLERGERYYSGYLDIPNKPLYSFGYGLSYTKFEISPVKLSCDTLTAEQSVTAKVVVKNIGEVIGTEVLQLYIRDIAASVVRPVKELKGFQKVKLNPGESREVSFEITEDMLRFLRGDGTVGSEPGQFYLWVGNSSDTENRAEFRLLE